VGPAAAKELARVYRSMDRLLDASEEELTEIEGIGPVIAAAWAGWASDPESRRLIERLAQGGVRVEEPAPEAPPGSELLAGVSVVVTGTLASMSREEAEEAVAARGGKATGSVSSRTTVLVVGEAPGASKVRKAAELGTQTLDEEGFLRMLEEGLPAEPATGP
jgi:DNA ligase (NAD+)